MCYSSMEPSQSSTKSELTLLGSVRSGTVSGLVAAWAIFGMILAVGAQLGLPPGTFYQMVGVSLGIDEEWPAIYLGFVMHMITGAIIGIVYMIISDRVRKLRTDSSTLKAFATGVATGIAVWAVLFVPLHFFLMQPTLQNMLLTSPPGSPEQITAERLLQMSDSILYGALAIHFVFGGVLGFMARISTSGRIVIENKAAG
ncbi:MAG: hypothetical protein QN423_07055 [Nitrososphaeraceae archaeon]|nr:hypothetical protein [Nitrososphaeraceae archaeon]